MREGDRSAYGDASKLQGPFLVNVQPRRPGTVGPVPPGAALQDHLDYYSSATKFPHVPGGRLDVPRTETRREAVSLRSNRFSKTDFLVQYSEGDENVRFLHKSPLATISFVTGMTK
jgi:hypothetical protein